MKIINGDCLEEMKKIPENSVDSIVTDPPYELGFMGKSWDSTGIANNPDMWREAMRVLKPGGHLLSFSGTRTYHRMAVAIEDAGFEVRDMIEWCYGSGFPKSRNIGLDVDKRNGITKNRGKAFVVAGQSGQRDKDTGGDLVPGSNTMGAYVAQNEWSGWGTSLKPAHEPICMARKPLAEKTVSENVLKYGTGGINIDESRVQANEELGRNNNARIEGTSYVVQKETMRIDNSNGKRFPANLIHDNSEEVRECFPETKTGKAVRSNSGGKTFGGENTKPVMEDLGYADGGCNASRFFKSIKKDLHCSLCYDILNHNHLTKNICNNTNVNNAGKSLETIQAITEDIAQLNAMQKARINLVQNVKSAGNLCDLCGTFIAQWLVEPKKAQSQESILGQVSITEPNLRILKQCLASFVELRGNTDTTPTMENLNLLFGYVFNAIENSTQNYEDTKNIDKNRYRSLVYYPKASKSGRNKGCEEMEEKQTTGGGGMNDPQGDDVCGKYGSVKAKASNFHPTIKPIALMEYLIKMVNPKGGTVLDPFMGSGSTGVAYKQNGFHFIGIEQEADYIEIAKKRIGV